MKNLKEYITEEQNFLVNKKLKNRQKKYEYHPENKNQLVYHIINLLQQGITDLNCIDVSDITDMTGIFYQVNNHFTVEDIDISDWDVSKVTRMPNMFYNCNEFNSDLSKWNVSNVTDIDSMFAYCKNFNSDLSNWDVSKVKWMSCVFTQCTKLYENNNVPAWYTKHL